MTTTLTPRRTADPTSTNVSRLNTATDLCIYGLYAMVVALLARYGYVQAKGGPGLPDTVFWTMIGAATVLAAVGLGCWVAARRRGGRS